MINFPVSPNAVLYACIRHGFERKNLLVAGVRSLAELLAAFAGLMLTPDGCGFSSWPLLQADELLSTGNFTRGTGDAGSDSARNQAGNSSGRRPGRAGAKRRQTKSN